MLALPAFTAAASAPVHSKRQAELNVLKAPMLAAEVSDKSRATCTGVGHHVGSKYGTFVCRITHFEEVEDSRYLIILDGLTRFELGDELTVMTPYRQFKVEAANFISDFEQGYGAERVNRPRFLKMMRDYAEFANFELNWDEINKTGTADLVNFCCMVSPYGAAEKQMLLEAPSLEDRAETLIALAEVEMARSGTGVPLQ